MILFFYLTAASCNHFLFLFLLELESKNNFISQRRKKNLWLYWSIFVIKHKEIKITLTTFLWVEPIKALRNIYFLSLHTALEGSPQYSGRPPPWPLGACSVATGSFQTRPVGCWQTACCIWLRGDGMWGMLMPSYCWGHCGFSSRSRRVRAAFWYAGQLPHSIHAWDGMCHHLLAQGLESHWQIERKVPFPFLQLE